MGEGCTDLPAAGDVPESNRTIPARRGQNAPVRRKRQSQNAALVGAEVQLLSGAGVPKAKDQFPAIPKRCHGLAVWTVSHSSNFPLVAAQRFQFVAASDVPYAERRVPASRDELPAIGREGNR